MRKPAAKTAPKPKAAPSLSVPDAVRLPIAQLHRAPYNPRHISEAKRASLRASILKHGMVENLVVQRRSAELELDYVLIGGHQRLNEVEALCDEKGWARPETMPCVVLDVDDRVAKQLNVALNNIGGEFDPYMLGELFAQMLPSMTTDDVLATGFTQDQLVELTHLALTPEQQAALLEDGVGELTSFAKSITLSIEFDTAEERDAAKELLKKVATERNVKAGRVVAEAVRAFAAMKGKRRPLAPEGRRRSPLAS